MCITIRVECLFCPLQGVLDIASQLHSFLSICLSYKTLSYVFIIEVFIYASQCGSNQ